MSRQPVDQSVRLYFLANSATLPSRKIAIDDVRVIIDNELGKKWIKETPAGDVSAETVIGGRNKHKVQVF